jgi:septum site-determining protein MinC
LASKDVGGSISSKIRNLESHLHPQPFTNMDQETGQRHASFEIKSADLPLVALLLKTDDLKVLQSELLQEFGPESASPDFFDHDGLVIDFSNVSHAASVQDLEELIQVLQTCSLLPVAVRNASPAWVEKARQLGLAEAAPEVHRSRPSDALQEVVREVIREVPGPTTMVIDKPLRSGQKIYARGADLVVLAMVNQGAEVIADGNIHVYAPLRGKAMAGARGNTDARIFSLCLEPELISIAGVYRTSENPLSPDVHSKPAQVRLSNDGQEKLLIEPLKS